MENIFEKFLLLMSSFKENDVEYIIIGGMAINLHGFARNTQDIEIFVEPSEKNIDKLKKSLMQVFNDKEINEIKYSDFAEYPVIRYGTEFGFYVDIIAGIGERFIFSDLKFVEKNIEGVNIKFADARTLYKLKENTYREIDQLDLKFLNTLINK